MTQSERLNNIINSSLYRVSLPHMVARYNSALKMLTGKETNLKEFHIDCCGYSPEIAKEFGEGDFLNPHGVNRQFILIDIAQEDLPSIMNTFSVSPFFVKQFIEENRKQILALTALDSVYGYIENNTPIISNLNDILNIKTIKVICDTPKNIVKINREVSDKVNELELSDVEKFLDIHEINNLAELCKKTKSVHYDCYLPKVDSFKKASFFTNHYGGFYLFRSGSFSVIIYMNEDEFPINNLPSDITAIHWKDHSEVLDFLKKHKILVPLCGKEIEEKHKSLESIKERVLYDFLSSKTDIDINTINKITMNSLMKDYVGELPEEYLTLNKILKQFISSCNLTKSSKHDFYTLKISTEYTSQHLFSLFNHLIVNYTDYSYRKMFKYNRELFLEVFETSNENAKEMIIKQLEKTLK